MPSQNIQVLADAVSLEELCNEVAKLQKILRYLLDGNLDFENVRVKGLTAETIDVDELSAISANLGTITAGLMQAVTILASSIYGTYIATANGTYPRAEISNTENAFGVHLNANQRITIEPGVGGTGNPSIVFTEFNGGLKGRIQMYTSFENTLLIACDGDIRFSTGAGFRVRFPSWSAIENIAAGNTLQEALNGKANSFSGVSGTVYVSSTPGGAATTPITFSNGVRTS